MRLAILGARIPRNDNRVTISPAEADVLATSLKHVEELSKHISCLEGGRFGETREVKRRMSSFCKSRTIEMPGCEEECWSPSSDYSDLHGDSTWGPDDEEDDDFASERRADSSRSGNEASSKKSLDDGSESGKTKPEGKHKCPVCGALHLKPSLLKQHMCTHSLDGTMQQNPKAYQIPCRTLKSRCLGPGEFWRVVLPSKELPRLFICSVENCGRQYKRQDHLNRHALTHKGNLFACTWEGCNLTFNVNSNLQRHLRIHEKWGANLLKGSIKPEVNLTCPESGCGKSFKYPSLLQTHTENVHGSLSITLAVCMEPGCGEAFDSLQMLKIHTKAAHSYVFCETCGISMLKKSLAAHLRTHEEGHEMMRCPHTGCLHSHSKKSNLDTHIRAIHMNLKPYACSLAGCGMRFAYRAVRDKHELCSKHVKPVLEGDFETEDSEFRLKSRGGRKRIGIQHVDDLLPKKYRFHPQE